MSFKSFDRKPDNAKLKAHSPPPNSTLLNAKTAVHNKKQVQYQHVAFIDLTNKGRFICFLSKAFRNRFFVLLSSKKLLCHKLYTQAKTI